MPKLNQWGWCGSYACGRSRWGWKQHHKRNRQAGVKEKKPQTIKGARVFVVAHSVGEVRRALAADQRAKASVRRVQLAGDPAPYVVNCQCHAGYTGRRVVEVVYTGYRSNARMMFRILHQFPLLRVGF